MGLRGESPAQRDVGSLPAVGAGSVAVDAVRASLNREQPQDAEYNGQFPEKIPLEQRSRVAFEFRLGNGSRLKNKTKSSGFVDSVRSAAKFLVLGLIRFYQQCLSPVLPSSCRFHPTCSCYASEAVERWGLLGGLKLTLRRLLQCRPLGGFGYDPVPDVRQVLRHTMPQVGGSE